MERRKIIQQGKGTLTMSLPINWVRQYGLSAGDDLFIEQKGLSISIAPALQRKNKKSIVDVSGFSRQLIYVVLHNLYVRGDDEVHLKFDSPEIYDSINEGVRGLLGFEILEYTGKTCVIKELARGEVEDFEQIMRRILLLLVGIAEDGVDAFKKKDPKTLELIWKRDESINKLVSYSLRMLNKRGTSDVQKAMHLYALLTLLEHLGDEYSRFYRFVNTMNQKTLLLTMRVAKLLRAFYELFYTFDKEKVIALLNERAAIRNETLKVAQCKEDIVAIQYLNRIIDLIVDIEKFNLAMQL